jgi:CheY-like chemotaxis protein
VQAAADGAEMLEALRSAPADYDLVVTDYAMPLLSGGEALIQARQIRPDLPGIIISGYAEAQAIGRKPSDVAVLTKPFGPDELRSAIDAIT